MVDHSSDYNQSLPDAATTARLAVDLGGTNIRVAAVTAGGQILTRRRAAAAPREGHERLLDRLAALVEQVAREAQLPARAPVGVALPAAVDPRSGHLFVSANLGWRDLPILALLRQRLARPVAVGNDANAAALGEWRYGAGQGVRDLIFIICGTGVGGGIIADGRLLVGKDGLASELGHMVVAIDGPRCHCGHHGCLEAFAGGWAIEETAQALLEQGVPSSLPALMEERREGLSGALINYAASQDDGLAIEVLARAGRALGLAIASLAHLLNPEVVAIGGGVVAADRFLLAPLREALAEQLLPGFDRGLRVVPSTLGQEAGLLGAAVLAEEAAD